MKVAKIGRKKNEFRNVCGRRNDRNDDIRNLYNLDGGKEMKMSELNMKCGECPLIDYCNIYDDTPPCSQPRFENLEVQDFLNVADYLNNRSLWEDEENENA